MGPAESLIEPTLPNLVTAASLAGASIPVPVTAIAALSALRPDPDRSAPAFDLPSLSHPPIKETADGLLIEGVGVPSTVLSEAIASARDDGLVRLLYRTGVAVEWAGEYVYREGADVDSSVSSVTRAGAETFLSGISEQQRRCQQRRKWFFCRTLLTVSPAAEQDLVDFARAKRKASLAALEPRTFVAKTSVSLDGRGSRLDQQRRAERKAQTEILATLARQIRTHVRVRHEPDTPGAVSVYSDLQLNNVQFSPPLLNGNALSLSGKVTLWPHDSDR